jgi:hypothetical protein
MHARASSARGGQPRARGSSAGGRQPRASWLAALAVLVAAVTAAVGWQGDGRPGHPASEGQATERATTDLPSPIPSAQSAPSTPQSATLPFAVPAAGSLVLSRSARRSCAAAASACVDLSARLTWLQSDGSITYGPVRMEPGPPGTPHKTPRGTFHVEWKAGADFVSTLYHDPMPYAVFFAPGGIAFHGGSLSRASHGCVHLDIGSARYYHDHLPVGAEVVVF